MHELLLQQGVAVSYTTLRRFVRRARHSVLFRRADLLLRDLSQARADHSFEAAFRRYLGLLIVDDFAMREYTTLQAEDLYEIVSRRYRRGSLVLTTNREAKDLYSLFPNPVLAEGLLDRLLSSAYVVTVLGRSYRPEQRPTGREEPAWMDLGMAN